MYELTQLKLDLKKHYYKMFYSYSIITNNKLSLNTFSLFRCKSAQQLYTEFFSLGTLYSKLLREKAKNETNHGGHPSGDDLHFICFTAEVALLKGIQVKFLSSCTPAL